MNWQRKYTGTSDCLRLLTDLRNTWVFYRKFILWVSVKILKNS
jgi:hypothetical protein